jgi:hypothetical protein
MRPEILAVIAALIIIVVIQVVIIRWVLRINEIVSVLNEQTDYLEDIAFRLKRCGEKIGVHGEEDIVLAKKK